MEEPSVLDYIKSRLMPWKYPRLEIPGDPSQLPGTSTPPRNSVLLTDSPAVEEQSQDKSQALPLPWISLLSFCLALIAQYAMSPAGTQRWLAGVVLLLLSLITLVGAHLREQLQAKPWQEGAPNQEAPSNQMRISWLALAVFAVPFTFLSFQGLRFTIFNLALLLLNILLMAGAFWAPERQRNELLIDLRRWLSNLGEIQIRFKLPVLVAIAAVAWVAFFRFYRLADVPPEMNSDHAEKILDVLRVLSGGTYIFFPTNGGREALQFYLVAALHRFFGFDLNFLTLKIVTAGIGFAALPFIYLLGKEAGGQRIGLLAFLFAGVAYWPNVVARAGMRLPFYILFTAALVYFLLHGYRTGKRNDFIYAGVALGLSLYGYTADRILPLLALVAAGLYLLHPAARHRRQWIIFSVAITALVSFVVFLPLLSYIVAEPEAFLQRTLTRMGPAERPLPGPALQIFLQNNWKALSMLSTSAGVVWPVSIPNYPALSLISGGLFYLGAGLVTLRYLRQRQWTDLFLLLSIPILMLPSTLALAFPEENPNLYRTGGSLVPVFVLVGVGLDALMSRLSAAFSGVRGQTVAWALALLIFGFHSLQDYDLVFHKYYQQYRISSWNSSEMGRVVTGFIDIFQQPEGVWVMGFPNWVDTRLVAINAGYPGRDYEMFVENDNPARRLEYTLNIPAPKLFLLNPDDASALEALHVYYPTGHVQRYVSQLSEYDKDFLIYIVPPVEEH